MGAIFDSHAHLEDESFDRDREQVVKRAVEGGLKAVLCPASSRESIKVILGIIDDYPLLYGAAGIHPHEALSFNDEVSEEIFAALGHDRVVAVGEIGLDYHYDFAPRHSQKKIFARQMEMAVESNIPVVIHVREAHGDAVALLQDFAPCRGVMHCFSGSVELAERYMDMGFHIGLGGALTFRNARKSVEVCTHVPMNRLLVETDAPYMAPVPFRGRRNEPAFVIEVIKRIANIKKSDVDKVAQSTCNNASSLFGLESGFSETGDNL